MFKRLSALFVALIMGLSLMAPVFADDPPAAATSTSTGTITVRNVPAGYSVKAYQIIKAAYNGDNFLGWQWTDEVANYSYTEEVDGQNVTVTPFSNGDDNNAKYITGITTDQLNTLVQLINGSQITLTAVTEGWEFDSDTKTYTNSQMNQGSYIILISPGKNVSEVLVFNPLIASINLSSAQGENGAYNILVSGSVDASGNLTEDADGNLVNQTITSANIVYAKSSGIDVEKTHTVANGKGMDSSGNSAQGVVDDINNAEEIEYKITTTTPDYRSDAFLEPKFTISDKLSKGLSYIKDSNDKIASLKVTIGTLSLSNVDDNGYYIYTYKDDNNHDCTIKAFTIQQNAATETDGGSFTITFTKDFLKTFGSLEVEVTYTAKLNEGAYTGFDPNTNTVTVNFSNDPSDSTSVKTITKRNRIYTFSLNGDVYGEYDIVKIPGEDFVKAAKVSSGDEESETVTEYLEGAQFTLYSNNNGSVGTALKTVTSDKEGKIYIDGLAAGTYWLKETKAPAGYALDSTPIKVVISATYDQNTGYLTGYSITFEPEGGTSHTVAYTGSFVMEKDEDGKDTDVIKVNTTDEYPMYTISYNGENVVINRNDEDGYQSSISTPAPYIFWNTKIGTLPSTGSFGTYAFIFIGCVIMACAVTMFVFKRKK